MGKIVSKMGRGIRFESVIVNKETNQTFKVSDNVQIFLTDGGIVCGEIKRIDYDDCITIASECFIDIVEINEHNIVSIEDN